MVAGLLFLSRREIPIFVIERQIANTDKTLEQLKMIPTAKSASAEEIPDYSYLMADGHSREFIWVCELSKEKPAALGN